MLAMFCIVMMLYAHLTTCLLHHSERIMELSAAVQWWLLELDDLGMFLKL